MPGMMDTVLNLGMSKAITEKMAENDAALCMGFWRRFIMAYGDIVRGTGRKPFDDILDEYKAGKG